EDWIVASLGADAPKIVHLAPGDNGTLIGLTGISPPVHLDAFGRVIDRIQAPAEMIPSSLRPFIRAADKSYYVGSMQVPPCLFRIKAQLMESIPVTGQNGNVHDIVSDSENRLWVGYGDGVCRVENTSCKS